jgi:Ca2+-binding RTX toxin-like protein
MTTTPTIWAAKTTYSSDVGFPGSSIAALREGGFAVVWERTALSGEQDIVGQLFTGLGAASGGDFLATFSAAESRDLFAPEVVQLTDGSLAVSYVLEFSATDRDIRAVIQGGAGYGTSLSFASIDSAGTDETFLYEIAATGTSQFFALYQRNDPAQGNDPVLLQRVDPNFGPQFFPVVSVDPATTQSQSSAELTVLNNGNVVVTWTSFDFGTLTNSLYFSIFAASNGTNLTGKVQLGPTPNNAFPVVEALVGGGFVIAWQDVNDSGFYHAVYDADGIQNGFTQFLPTGFAILPRLSALLDGGYVVAWSDFSGTELDGSPEGDVALQRFSANGQPIGGRFQLDDPGDENLEDIETLTDGRIVLTFSDETGDSTNVEVRSVLILDPREAAFNGSDAADALVARLDDSTIRALGGDDRITGMGGDDELSGDGGNDSITGGDGDDLVAGGSGNDNVAGQAGDDTVKGGSGDDTLFGGDGSDRLVGGSGNDELSGGAGGDRLAGGSGRDTFVFKEVAASLPTIGLRDTIEDFTQGEDRIDLKGIDAKAGTGGNQKFSFIGNSAFTAEGQLRAVQLGADTLIEGNTAGAGGAEFAILVLGTVNFVAGDFIL